MEILGAPSHLALSDHIFVYKDGEMERVSIEDLADILYAQRMLSCEGAPRQNL